MNLLTTDTPLTQQEMGRLDAFLESCGENAMDVEMLDGFFAALIAGPELVPPSEYLPEIFGGEVPKFKSKEEAGEIMGLLFRHSNAIADTLAKNEPYAPLMSADEDGKMSGNAWAAGFLYGMALREDSWDRLVSDGNCSENLLPMMLLGCEHHPDKKLRPPPITPEMREEVIGHICAAVPAIYQYFRSEPQPGSNPSTSTIRRAMKIGRNERCPCGSGKKYKRCCGSGSS